MGGPVDALRQARHHADASLGEAAAEHRGDLPPDAGGVARPDDADPASVQGREIAADEQRRRGMRVVTQRGRELGVAQGDDADAGGRTAVGPLPRSAPIGRRPPRRPQRRREEVGDGRRWTRLTSGHRVGLDRIMVGEQAPAAGPRSSGRSRRARRRDRLTGRHAVSTGTIRPPDPAVAARSRARIDNAISTCSTSTASGGGRRASALTVHASRSAIVRATRRIRW